MVYGRGLALGGLELDPVIGRRLRRRGEGKCRQRGGEKERNRKRFSYAPYLEISLGSGPRAGRKSMA